MDNKDNMIATIVYNYGMRSRGFSPGAQPKDGLLEAEADPFDEYWNVLIYSRKLTKQECHDYELDELGARMILQRRTEK